MWREPSSRLAGRGEGLREDLLALVDLGAQQLQILAQFGVVGMGEFGFAQDDRHRRQRAFRACVRPCGEGAEGEDLFVLQRLFAGGGKFAVAPSVRSPCGSGRGRRRRR